MPIGRKLTLLMWLTTSAMLVAAGAGFAAFNYAKDRAMLRRDARALAEIIGASSEAALRAGDGSKAEEVLRALHARPRFVGARLFDGEGKPLASYRREGVGEVQLPESVEALGSQEVGGLLLIFQPVTDQGKLLGTVCLVANVRGALVESFWETVLMVGLLLVAALVLTALVASRAQSVVSEPILELADVAADVAENEDYSVRANKRGEDETGALVDTFNEMLDRIQQREAEIASSTAALEQHQLKLQNELMERARAEVALRASEERFRQIAESINEVFWVADIGRNEFVYVSPAYEHVWGRSCASLYANAKSAVEAIHPDDVERVKAHAAAANPEGALEAVYRVVRPDGTIRWVRDRAFSVMDEDGKPYRIVGIAEDITESRKAEEALRESEQRFRELVEAARDVIFVLGADGTIRSLNPAFEQTTGRKAEDWIGRPFAPLIHPDDLPKAMELFAATLRGERSSPFELRVCSITGEYLTAEFATSPHVHEGNVIGVLGIGRDISERKRTEEALRRSEEKFRTLAETMAAGTFIFQNEKLVYVNEAAQRMTGYASAELLKQDFWKVIHPDHLVMVRERGRARLRGESVPSSYEVKILTKSGETRWVAFTAGMIDYQGAPAVLGTAFDITGRKLAEERLRKLQQEQQTILDLVPSFIWYKDCHNRILRLNRAAAQSIGKSVGEIEGRRTEEFYPDEAAKYYADDLEVIHSGKPKLGIVEELLTASGEKRWVQTDKVPMRDERGEVIGVIVSAMDITERKRAEEELRTQAMVLQNMAEGVVVSSEEGVMLLTNPAFDAMFGYERGELTGKHVSIVNDLPPEENARLVASVIEVLQREGEWAGEFVNRKKDGTRIITLARISKVELSGRVCWVCVQQDITARKRDEAALRDAEEKWRSLMDNSRDIISIVNDRGDILYINRVLTGFDKAKVIGTNTFDYVSPENRDVQRRALASVFGKGEPQYYEVEGAGAEAKATWYETRAVPITHDGAVIAAMLISSDISDRKRLEREVLEISEREQQRIGQDLHDGLCQHLVGTSLAVQLLAENLESRHDKLAEDARKIAELIGQAITQSRRIARGLYPVQLEESGLMSALSEFAVTISKLFYVSCRFECDETVTVPDTLASIHLYRIAQEAVSNALKHGKATVIVIRLKRKNGDIILSVADNGTGMPQGMSDHDGMGLRIMSYRAKLIGGDLTIQPRPKSKGTLVECRVPRRPSQGGIHHAN
jgi:PAS domain S-box-containing protein